MTTWPDIALADIQKLRRTALGQLAARVMVSQ